MAGASVRMVMIASLASVSSAGVRATVAPAATSGLALSAERFHTVSFPQAFLEHGGFQCSFCTPGMILMTASLLEENRDPSLEEIKEYLAGNLCRCASYLEILDSVLAAVKNAASTRPAQAG